MPNQTRDATADAGVKEFAASVAHRLAHPVQNVANAITLLSRDDLDTESRRQLRQVVDRAIENLIVLVDELRNLPDA